MHTVTKWIEKKHGLKVNMTKTKVTTPSKLKYLGFGFWKDSEGWKARPHQDSVVRVKCKLKKLTSRRRSISMDERIAMLNAVIGGWINYYRIGSMKQALIGIDKHLRNRMRIVIWKQWKKSEKRYWGLHLISKEILARRGLLSCVDYYLG